MNMKPIMNRKGLYALVCALMGLTFGMLTSCSDDLDVQQSYPFTVETIARYTIRYFQPDGEGKLRMDDGMVLLPNDRYPLDREVFRLYYTSECEDQQSIDIYFEDNSEPAQLFQLTFDFNNETEDDGGRGYRGYFRRQGTACRHRITMNLTCLWE